MTKILFLFSITLMLISCSYEENKPNVTYETLAIDSCKVTDSFVFGKTYPMELYYKIPSSCNYYRGIYYDKMDNIRTFAIQSIKTQTDNCITYNANSLTNHTESVHIDFKVTSYEPYIFKFWSGKNVQGQDTYLQMKIPVIN